MYALSHSSCNEIQTYWGINHFDTCLPTHQNTIKTCEKVSFKSLHRLLSSFLLVKVVFNYPGLNDPSQESLNHSL